jgi:hypothetical protein
LENYIHASINKILSAEYKKQDNTAISPENKKLPKYRRSKNNNKITNIPVHNDCTKYYITANVLRIGELRENRKQSQLP